MWALARFCAPWVPSAGEKGKNALPRARRAFGLRRFGTAGRGWEPVKAFFSFSPGNCLRCKKRAKAHTPRRAAIPGVLIDVPPRRSWRGRLLRLSAFICGYKRRGAEAPHAAVIQHRGLGDRRGVAESQLSHPGFWAKRERTLTRGGTPRLQFHLWPSVFICGQIVSAFVCGFKVRTGWKA